MVVKKWSKNIPPLLVGVQTCLSTLEFSMVVPSTLGIDSPEYPAILREDQSLMLVNFLRILNFPIFFSENMIMIYSSLKANILLAIVRLCLVKSQLFKWINQM